MEHVELELLQDGEGPVLLMLPGSFATPSAWKGIRAELGGSCRVLSTSLPGYGPVPEMRPAGDDDIVHLVEFVHSAVAAAGEPVHLIGHSWGAQLALAAVLAGRIAPLSLVLFEANPVFARPPAGVFPWRAEIDAMVERFATALAEGDPDAAAIIIDFYSRSGAFQMMPDPVRAFCRAHAATNLRDWRSAATFAPQFGAFAALELPVTLIRGGTTPTPIVDVTASLAETIPGAGLRVVEGADHFLISTHPAECAALLNAHLATLAG